MSKVDKSITLESQLVVARGWRRRELGLTVARYRVSLCGDKNALESDNGDGCTT